MRKLFKAVVVTSLAVVGLVSGQAFSAYASASAQATSPLEVVRAFAEAMNKSDVAATRALVDPDGLFIDNPGTPFEGRDSLGLFVEENVGQVQVQMRSTEQTGPNTVVSDYVLSGPAIPPLPSPVTAHAVFTVENGRITRMEQTFAAQTLSEFQQWAQAQGGEPAGMPSTGAGTSQWLPWVWVAVGATLLAALGGLVLQRVRSGAR